MSRMPGARWLGEHGSRTMERFDIVAVHTIVGRAPAHAAHFSTHADGTIDQSRDTRYRSAANLEGNHRIIAIENEDMGGPFPAWSGSDVPPLTDEQVEACAQILAWAHREHGVPLQLCPDSRPESRGLAYHRQGIDGNFEGYRYPGRRAGGETWTEHFGKVCPGDRRIAQLPAILARAEQIIEGDDMSWDEKIPRWNVADLPPADDDMAAEDQLKQARGFAQGAYRRARMADIRTERIEAAMRALAAGLGAEVQAAVEAALEDAVIDVNVNVDTGGSDA